MFSGSFSMKMNYPEKGNSKISSDKKKEKEDNYVQGYNYHWELTPFEPPYFSQSISEDKAGD
jgi:hypothetical protein